jgi:hypothetical protein
MTMSAAIRNHASIRNWEATGFSPRKRHHSRDANAHELCLVIARSETTAPLTCVTFGTKAK